jgi:addiction module RelE/StbE family toxin
MTKARHDLENIYSYIAGTLMEPGTAMRTIEVLEEGIFSLESMPYRCPERQRGIYAKKGYRQLFIKNYAVVYRVDEDSKRVIIVTVRYSASDF